MLRFLLYAGAALVSLPALAANTTPNRVANINGGFAVEVLGADCLTSNWPCKDAAKTVAALNYLNPKGKDTYGLESGVHIIRDQVYGVSHFDNGGGTYLDDVDRAIKNAGGYKWDIYMSYNGAQLATFDWQRDAINAWGIGNFQLIEGPLEVDNFGLISGPGYKTLAGVTRTGWQAPVAWAHDIYMTWPTANLALYSLAEPLNGCNNHAPECAGVTSPAIAAANALGVNLVHDAKLGNVHYYQKEGRSPGDPSLVNCAEPLSRVVAQSNGIMPGVGFVVTETGYSVVNQGACGEMGADKPNALYNLQGVFDGLRQGAQLVNIYQLFDKSPGCPTGDDQGCFGLFAYDAVTPKIGANLLRNFFAIHADTGATNYTFTPTALDFSTTGLAAPGFSFLDQASNGHYFAITYPDASTYTGGVDRTASLPIQTVTVNFGRTFNHFRLYDPLNGSASVFSYDGVWGPSYTYNIQDRPGIIEAW